VKASGYERFVSSLSVAIRSARESAGLSQEQVAFDSGVSVRHYQKIEAGDTANPKLENLYGIAAALGLPLSELVERAEPARRRRS
jgi:transcriptional regulator with XRE-family HTH domain